MAIDHFVLLPYRSDGVFEVCRGTAEGIWIASTVFFSSSFFFLLFFFSFLERQRRGRNIGRPSFENKIEQNRGFEKDMKWKEESFLRLMKSGTRIFLGKIISYILSYLFLIL